MGIKRRLPGLRWKQSDFQKPADELARKLLGSTLVSRFQGQLASGIIVETEAYLPQEDSACHAVRGRTASNASMFEKAGTAYVYPIHSRCCFNVVAGKSGAGTAVLIRSLIPLSGISAMMTRRNRHRPLDLCRGPARTCEALGIDRSSDGIDLASSSTIWIVRGKQPTVLPDDILVTERIGVTSAKELPLRFAIADCRYVSGPVRLRRRPVPDRN